MFKACETARTLTALSARGAQELHDVLFPISYEAEFFQKATLGCDSIASIAAFVRGELVAFITYRTVPYHSCEDQVQLAACGRRRGAEALPCSGTAERGLVRHWR